MDEAALADAIRRAAPNLPDAACGILARYLRAMARWNRVHNLTAIRDIREMIARHLLDSLLLLPSLPRECGRIADIGSGAGLPGIPLAAARPDCEIFLVESRLKRAAFLRQTADSLSLSNVRVVESRAEKWRPPFSFSAIVSRATGTLRDLAKMTRHLFSPPQILLALKSRDPQAECAEFAREFPSANAGVFPLDSNPSRYLVRLEIP